MKKLIAVIVIYLILGAFPVYAEKLSTEPCLVEALVFSGVKKHQVYIDVDMPNQKCDEQESAILDPKIFGQTSAFTNLQLASIYHQEIQLIVDGCIDAKDVEGPVDEMDKIKSFPRIVDIVYYSGMKFFP